MFLSPIVKKTKRQIYNNLIKYLKLNMYIKKIETKMSFLKQIDEKKGIKSVNFIYDYSFRFKPKTLIKYIISINLLEKNTFLNVTDIKGNLRFFRSSGFVNLKGKRKIKQPLVLKNLIDSLKREAKFLHNETVALHLTNISSFSYRYILSKLEEKIFIIFIRVFDLKPHNGCRPRKIKRRKNRRKK
jgi:ribosomal protein S11